MKTKLIYILLVFAVNWTALGQINLNKYKYIIVPKKFDFLKQENQYRLNELSAFLFNKNGFIALTEGSDYPKDLLSNRCLALNSDVLKESGMLKTKLKIVLKNCNDKIIYTSNIGQSREKQYKVAYNIALRDAFNSFKALNYSFKPDVVAPKKQNKAEENTQYLEHKPKPVKAELDKATKVTTPNVTPHNLGAKANTKTTNITNISTQIDSVLYAQTIKDGFQLVDKSPKVVFKIKNTDLKNVFLVDGKSAIIYQIEHTWYLEEITSTHTVKKELNIKF